MDTTNNGKGTMNLKPMAVITKDEQGISVSIEWSGIKLDRPISGGWSVGKDRAGKDHTDLAQRLVRAINAGKACVNPEVKTDINGKTYIAWTSTILGRHMNADLRRLGF